MVEGRMSSVKGPVSSVEGDLLTEDHVSSTEGGVVSVEGGVSSAEGGVSSVECCVVTGCVQGGGLDPANQQILVVVNRSLTQLKRFVDGD